jgi:hypothetical protein
MHAPKIQPSARRFEPRSFGRYLEELVRTRRPMLPRVGGNFAIHVPGIATWVVITEGPKPRVVEGTTGEPLAFAMLCPAELLTGLFGASGANVDIEAEIARGTVELAGDPNVLVRFLELGARRSALEIRAGGAR